MLLWLARGFFLRSLSPVVLIPYIFFDRFPFVCQELAVDDIFIKPVAIPALHIDRVFMDRLGIRLVVAAKLNSKVLELLHDQAPLSTVLICAEAENSRWMAGCNH
jgi:hypothetical protein